MAWLERGATFSPVDASPLVSEVRRLAGFIAALALLLAPLFAVLWLGAGAAVARHPTRAVVLGIAWVMLVGYVVFGAGWTRGTAEDLTTDGQG